MNYSNKNKKSIRDFGKYNFIIAVAILLVGAGYLMMANQSASTGVKMNDLQKQSDQLQLENQALATKVADLQSISRIESESNRLQLVSNGTRQFLNTMAATVALK